MLYHDTHTHLEMLAQNLELLPSIRELCLEDIHKIDPTTLQNFHLEIDKYLQNHELSIHPTVSNQNFLVVYELFKNNPKIKFLYGAHPEIVDADFDPTNFLKLEKQTLAVHINHIIGFGECGLDYYYTQDKNIYKLQAELFEGQIELAIEHKLPLIIHCREAFNDLFKILQKYPKIHGRFLIHCFTGDLENLKNVLDLGGLVAYGGIITFGKNADYLRETVKNCPDDSFVLETDLPFLAPAPHRGQTCLPEHINQVAIKIAELKNLSTKDVWNLSRKNTAKLFKV